MKAISIWQPWASLIAVGAKRIETRHWAAPASVIGERVAIHAAKRKPGPLSDRMHEALGGSISQPVEVLPLGVIVCTVVIDRCEAMTRDLVNAASRTEVSFGEFVPGRYAWFLRDVEETRHVEMRGSQGFYDVPDAIVRALDRPYRATDASSTRSRTPPLPQR